MGTPLWWGHSFQQMDRDCRLLFLFKNLDSKKIVFFVLYFAAHCFQDPFKHGYSIRYASNSPESGGIYNKVERYIMHPRFNEKPHWNDIALVEVNGFINTQFGVPVNLPSPYQQASDNTYCLVSGWGDTKDDNLVDGELRAVGVPIWNQSICGAAHPRKISEHMICAGYEKGGRDACQVNL